MDFPLVGNQNVKNVLNNAFKTGHIPHAIIIEGEDGLGKHTLAEYIAKCCVCSSNTPPCNECKGCHMANVGSHPDIRRIAPEEKRKNIDIAQIRNLRSEAYVMPQNSLRKVFLISKAETMNANSANALLKVLEEPPGGAVFMLITAYSASLLPTVRSRCVTLSLVPPPFESAVKYIKDSTNSDINDIQNALKNANSNIGVALSSLKRGDKNLSEKAAEEFYQSYLLGDEYAMLLSLHPLEKDRVATEDFFVRLKSKIAEQIKQDAQTSKNTKKWYSMYEICNRASEALPYNISLPLLFSGFCSQINSID